MFLASWKKILVEVYAGKEKDTLNKLRHIEYNQKLTTSTKAFQLCSLPPTLSAAKLHIQRTYFQVQEWMQLEQDRIDLNPLNWEWEDSGSILLPVLSNEAVAPNYLLKCVRCECKGERSNQKCSCKAYGVVCSIGCTEYRGQTCKNRGPELDSAECELE